MPPLHDPDAGLLHLSRSPDHEHGKIRIASASSESFAESCGDVQLPWKLLLTERQLAARIECEVVFPTKCFSLTWRTPMEEMIVL